MSGLTYKVTENGDLHILADAEMQSELTQMRAEDPVSFTADQVLIDVFESLVSNSELQWVSPERIGAMTDAPILGIVGESYPIPVSEDSIRSQFSVGRFPNDDGVLCDWFEDVTDAWGFMDYAVRSPLDDLADRGVAVFKSGN